MRADQNALDAANYGGVTATGRAYSNYGSTARGSGLKEWGAARRYRKATKGLAKNKHTTAFQRAKGYDAQIADLGTLLGSSKQSTREHYTGHANELLVNIQSMIRQIGPTDDPGQKMILNKLRDQERQLKAALGRP